MGSGLLGALGGLGEGLTQVGRSWEVRRERALEWARKLQEQQQEQGFRAEQRQLDRQATDARSAAAQQAQTGRTKMTLEARKAESEANRQFKSGEALKDRAARRDLVRLNKSLERDNSAASERLRRSLSAGDVHSVQYGAPDANGYAEVIVVTDDGQIRRTGQKVYRPKKDEENEGEAL